jgi:hypothetical protein
MARCYSAGTCALQIASKSKIIADFYFFGQNTLASDLYTGVGLVALNLIIRAILDWAISEYVRTRIGVLSNLLKQRNEKREVNLNSGCGFEG